MGGGAAITRAASKVPGLGASLGGLRGPPAAATALPGEHSVRTASRLSPVGIVSYQAADAPSSAALRSAAAWDWEVDDWEFAECDDDSVRSAGEPMPRVVFEGVPTYQEAEAATAELKDAVEKVYLSPNNSAGTRDSVPVNQASVLSILPSCGLESKPLVPSESAVSSPVSRHAVQAFTLLSQNPAAQSIVASIASDPNVWNAVLQNEAFLYYLKSQRAGPETESDTDVSSEEADSEDWKSPKFGEPSHSADNPFANFEDGLKNMIANIKFSVTEMVSTVSTYLDNFFGIPGSEKSEADCANGGSILLDRTFGASFMGLAVLVVMVILLRRV